MSFAGDRQLIPMLADKAHPGSRPISGDPGTEEAELAVADDGEPRCRG